MKIGENQQKILLLLMSGVALTFSASPLKSWHVMRGAARAWKEINQRALKSAIRKLYQSRLVREKHESDGTISLTLTEVGKERVLRFSLDDMKIQKPKRWDGKWRMVLFDIPEPQRRLRDAFRGHLKHLGFYEFQKSAFIHPYSCADEVNFLIEFYNAREYVRIITAESFDNELHLRSVFQL